MIPEAAVKAAVGAWQAGHELDRTQLAPDVYAWCKCGAKFDAYGNKGALNKLKDHIARMATE